jgi:photosystem II stability/assembly factor-like uncharacterized protein
MAAGRPDPGKVRPSNTGLVFQSVDGGQTWQDASAGLPEKLDIWSVFSGGGKIFVGSEGRLYSSNAGTATPVWEESIFMYGGISDISMGRAGLYLSSYGNGLFQHIPGTDIWNPMHGDLADRSVRTVLETPDGALFVGTDSGIYKSVNKGKNWKQVFDKGLVLDFAASGGVLIAGGAQGVMRSTDGGEHWEKSLDENILAKKTGKLKDRFVTVLGTRDPFTVTPEGITNRLRTSDDGGKTWRRIDASPLPVQGMFSMDGRLSEVLDVFDITQVGEYLFCSFDSTVFRSSDQGKTWEPVLTSKRKMTTFNFAGSGGVIYAVLRGSGC